MINEAPTLKIERQCMIAEFAAIAAIVIQIFN